MLEEKLDVLVVADVIDEDTKKYILKASVFFQNEMKINDETKVEVFLIHLAMAESRRRKNEVLDAKMEEIIRNEVNNHHNFAECKEVWSRLSNYIGEEVYSENELEFIYLHLLNLLEGDKDVS